LNDTKSLLKYTLEKLANDRVSRLKAEVEDNQKLLPELLAPVYPEIEEILKETGEEKEEKITYAWSLLAAIWQKNMLDYLQNLLKASIHVIQLPSHEIGRATAIYESINKGGLSLSTYDLVVAKGARDRNKKSLTQRIIEMLNEEIELSDALLSPIVKSIPKKMVFCFNENCGG